MRILILSHFAGSSRHGMVLRNYAMAREWVRQGHEVTVVGCAYSHYRAVQPRIRGRIGEETIDGIRYVWLWGPRYNGKSALGRLLGMAAFTLQCLLMKLPLAGRHDVVMASSPHPFVIYPAARLARRDGARLVYDIRDLWPLTPILLGGFKPGHPFIRALQHAEDYACRHADLVTAVPHNAGPYLAGRGLPPERFMPVPNGISLEDPAESSLPQSHLRTLRALKDTGAFILGYCGTLGTANAMDLPVRALAEACAHTHLVMLGDGANRDDLAQLAQTLGVGDRVHFLAPVPRAQVARFLEWVDVAYVGGHASPLYAYGASVTKLNDYMLASLPILYGLGDAQNAVEQSGAGLTYPPGDIADFLAALGALTGLSPEERRELGLRGRQWLLAHRLVSDQVRDILNTLDTLPPRWEATIAGYKSK
jgi:glycosyltransferase involved in cell wall biosynthesis